MDYMNEIVKRWAGKNDRLVEAFGRVDRAIFLPPSYKKYASYDMPLPIGYGQTTSQPSLVADIIGILDITPGDKVLEVGTGTGYQAAVMAELGADVYTVEKVSALYEEALKNLSRYPNVRVFLAREGVVGLPEHAPFDKIVVAAAATDIVPELVEQLADGGKMIIPVGDSYAQWLTLVQKSGGEVSLHRLYPVRFVPLIR